MWIELTDCFINLNKVCFVNKLMPRDGNAGMALEAVFNASQAGLRLRGDDASKLLNVLREAWDDELNRAHVGQRVPGR